ncbi:MAG: hypothetical protein H7Z17_03640 [Fuerstia sp.]|nr:hypothetical protein [Fuerstiella sp.]
MRILSLSTLLFVLITQSISAQDAPLEMIPGSASVVIRLQAPETTVAELAAFINKVQPGFGDLAKGQLPAVLGQVISNPTLAGVDQTQDWYVALFADDDRNMKGVLLLPTKDSAQLKTALGSAFKFAEKDGWLACSKAEQYLGEFERCQSGEVESIARKIDDRTKSALMSGHLCVVVNGPALKAAFEDELASAEDRLKELIQAIGNQIKAGSPQMDMAFALDMYRDLGKVLLQGVRDSNSTAISVKVTDDAVQIEHLLTVEADSQTDTFFKTQPVSDMARLTTLPEGLAGYIVIHGDPHCILDWSEQMMRQMLKEDDLKEKASKSIALMRDATIGTLATGGDLLPDEDTAMRYFAVSEISPSSVVREAFQILGTGMEYEIAGIRQKQTIEMDAETIDGQSVHIFRTEQTMPEGFDPTGMQKALNEKLYGPDGMVQRIVLKDDVALQTMGGDSESMKLLMTATSWSDSQLLAARARQHEKANVLILVDVPNTVEKFAKLILGLGVIPVPVRPEQLDGLVIAPSYAGFSAAVEQQRLTARTSIPVETFRGFVQIAMFVRQLQPQAR